ncbi:MAG: hypothetical protein FWC38_00615 [Proteobacteria bacterium]|nr:hypothetical protein [Pseudomonadota bacterium]MCL2306744.1 hypothetical protein [Pseudomonadota bacterium]
MSANNEFRLKITADGKLFVQQVGAATGSWKEFQGAAKGAGDTSEKTGKSVRASGDAASAAAKGFDGLTGTIGKLIGVAASAIGIFATLKKGISFNSQIEDARIGMAAMISAQNELRDATGKVLDGQEAFNAALHISNEQLRKLKLEGVNTTAEFSELVTVFKGILAPAQALNMSIDDTRKLTVSMTQVANALAIPMSMVENEVRAILQGTMRQEHQMHRALGITKELVDEWSKAGKLAEELDKRTRMFAISAEMASRSWSGMKAGLGEIIKEFSGGITQKLQDAIKDAGNKVFDTMFDVKTREVNEKLLPLINGLNGALGSVGDVIGRMMTGLMDGAIRLSGWINDNKEALSGIAAQVGRVWDITKQLVGVVAKIVGDVADWAVKSGAVEAALLIIEGLLLSVYGIVSETAEMFFGAGEAALTLNNALGTMVVTYAALKVAAAAYHAVNNAGLLASIKNVNAVKLGFGVLFAAVAGWQIGTLLRERFIEVRLAGIALVNGLLKVFEHLKYGVLLVWARIETAFTEMVAGFQTVFGNFLLKIAAGLEKIPKMDGAAAALKAYADEYLESAAKTETFAEAQIRLKKELAANLSAINQITDDMADYEIAQEQAKKSTNGTKDAISALGDAADTVTTKAKAMGKGLSESAKSAADEWGKFLESIHKKATLKIERGDGLTGEYLNMLKGLDQLLSGVIVNGKKLNITQAEYNALKAEEYAKTPLGLKQKAEENRLLKLELDALNAVNEAKTAYFKTFDDVQKAIERELEQVEKENELFGLTKVQVAELTLEKLKLQQATIDNTIATQRAWVVLQTAVEQQERLINVYKQLDQKTQVKKAFDDMVDRSKKAAEQISQTLTDAIMRGFENGKGFLENFRDAAVNLFKTMILRPIVEFTVNSGLNLFGSLMGGGGGSGSNLFSSFMSMFGSGGNVAGKSFMQTIGNGFTGIFGQFQNIFQMFATSGMGQTLGLSQMGPVFNSAGQMSIAPQLSGGAASFMRMIPYIGWIIAAMTANDKLYGQGWQPDGQRNDMVKELGKHAIISGLLGSGGVLGGVFLNGAIQLGLDKLLQNIGFSGRIASLLTGSALWTRVFGYKKPEAREGGVSGSLTMGGFEGEMFQDWFQQGGLFRRNRRGTEKAPMDRRMSMLIDQTIGRIPRDVSDFLKEFGKSFEDVFGEDWSQNIRVVLTSGKWDDVEDKLRAETVRIFREMATTAVESIREGWGEYVTDLKDLDPEEFQAEIGKIFHSLRVLDDIKGVQQRIFGVTGLTEADFEAVADKGELIYETIARLTDTFTATNRLARITGINFEGVGLDGAADRQALVDDAGGIEPLAELMASFWDAFASESDKFGDAAEVLRNAFADIETPIPSSIEAYRALVASMDMSTESGRQMALQLMQLGPAFNAVIGTIEQMSRAMDKSIGDLRRTIEFGGLSDQEKYNRLKEEADAAYIEFQNATDPAEIQRLFDRITSNMGEAWSLLSADEQRARREEYLRKLDELQASKDDRIGTLIDIYTGVDAAEKNIVDAGNTLAQAILDVAKQLGADVYDVVLRDLPDIDDPVGERWLKPIEEIMGDIKKPIMIGLEELNDAATALNEARNSMSLDTKPLLLDNDPDAAFIAAHQLIKEAAQQQASSGESFGESVGSSAESFVEAVSRAAAMQQQAGSHSAAAMSAAAGSLYALAMSLQEQAAASQQKTQKIRASELN